MLHLQKEPQETLEIQEIYIPYDSAQRLKSAFSHLRMSDDSAWLNSKEWLGSTVKHSLPNNIVETIEDFTRSEQQSALIIRGLPVDADLCSTPYQGYLPPSQTPLVSACHIGIYQLAKIEPIAYKTENNGFLFRHVVPSMHSRNEKSSHGSTHTFGHHVDNPDLPLLSENISQKSGCPEYLSLMALRTDLRVRSNFMLLDDILSNLSQGVIEALSLPQFQIARPDSFGQDIRTVLPLLTYDKSGIALCRYDKENTTPLNEQAAAALVMLDAQLKETRLQNSITYQPGDLLIIKNQRLLHSREGFSPRDDGTDRWLMRLFGMKSLSRLVQAYSDVKHIGKD